MGFYCIPLRDLLAKLNIKHRMCCKKPIDYMMLTKFFLDIIAWLYGEGGNSHILAYIYRMCHFYGTQFLLENKNLWVYFLACNSLFGQILIEH